MLRVRARKVAAETGMPRLFSCEPTAHLHLDCIVRRRRTNSPCLKHLQVSRGLPFLPTSCSHGWRYFAVSSPFRRLRQSLASPWRVMLNPTA